MQLQEQGLYQLFNKALSLFKVNIEAAHYTIFFFLSLSLRRVSKHHLVLITFRKLKRTFVFSKKKVYVTNFELLGYNEKIFFWLMIQFSYTMIWFPKKIKRYNKLENGNIIDTTFTLFSHPTAWFFSIRTTCENFYFLT